jgi:RecA-family ATPase
MAETSPKEAQPLALIDAGALAGVEVEPREFVVSRLVPAALLSLFTAPGGGGKSYISLNLAASVAIGAMAYGLTTIQAPTIYITAEDDDDENHRRLIGVANALGESISSFSGKLYLLSLVARTEKGLARFDPDNRMTVLPLFHELRVTIQQTGARLMVLDNVAHLFEGNENHRAQVAAFIGLLNALALETQCAIILISHPNKAGDSFSGSTAFQNQVRSHIHMEIDEKDPDVRRIKLAKANYARLEEPLRLRWHRGAFRLEASIPPNELNRSARHKREAAQFLACLALRNAAQLPVSMHPQAARTYAPKVFAGMPEGKGLRVQQYAVAMARLLAAGTIAQSKLDYSKPGSAGHKAEGLLQLKEPEECDDEPF